MEMAAAFHRAGFAAVDVHMSDILRRRRAGTVQGPGRLRRLFLRRCAGRRRGLGQEHSVQRARARAVQRFFQREDSFTLGVCNGCQMVSTLKDLIPGAAHWPRFVRNRSEQFEARLALVRVESSPSVLLSGMAGSHLPIAVAHGEGGPSLPMRLRRRPAKPAARWPCAIIDNDLSVASRYPANPNGSPAVLPV